MLLWLFCVFCSDRLGGLGPPQARHAPDQPHPGRLEQGVAPQQFCRFVFLFLLGLVALFVFFFWVGGVPLAVFSPPPVSWFWVVGWGIFACSCVLHLSLATRATWSLDPQTPPAPTAPCLSVSCLTHLLLGVVGGTR